MVYYCKILFCSTLIGISQFSGIAQSSGQMSEQELFELRAANSTMVVNGSLGARVTSYKIGDFEVLAGPEAHPFFNGSTLWLSPEGKWKGHGALDNGRYAQVPTQEGHLNLVSQEDEERGFQFSKTFLPNPADTSFVIRYTIKNLAKKEQKVAPWEVTRVPTGGLAFIPKRDERDIPTPNKMYPLPPLKDQGGLIWYPFDEDKSSPQKFFMDGGKGWMAYVMKGILFVKSFPLVPRGEYAPGESNVELYVNKGKTYLELENQGAYQRLEPDGSLTYSVKWLARKLPVGIKVEAGNLELVDFVEQLIEQGVRAQENNLKQATAQLVSLMLEPKAEGLEHLFSENLSYGHSGGLVENKDEIIKGLTEGSFHFDTIEINNETVAVHNDIGIVRHVLTTNYSDSGNRGTLTFGILLVWRSENGKWKLIARQAAKL